MGNPIKTASARRTRNRFAEHLAPFYKKPLFWHRAYFVGSVGGATLDTTRAYVDAQGTEEHARKAVAKANQTGLRQTVCLDRFSDGFQEPPRVCFVSTNTVGADA